MSTFSILSDTSKLRQNPRVTYVEGVLIHSIHSVCMVVCKGEAYSVVHSVVHSVHII